MKTAMTELIEKIEHAISYNVEGGLVAKYTWEELLADSYALLEKEKEHICNTYVEGFNISGEGWNGEYGIKDFNNIKEEISAEQYYNDKFNIKTNNL